MIAYSKSDYLILQLDKKKRELVRVAKNTKTGIVPNNQQFDDKAILIPIDPEKIVANLGTKPPTGVAYGVKIQPVLFRDSSEHFGNIYIHCRMQEIERTLVLKVIKLYGKLLTENGWMPTKEFYISLRDGSNSKHAGYYHHHNKKDKPDELALMPTSWLNKRELKYYVTHELSHAIWFTRLPSGWKAKWVRAYHKNITLSKAKTDVINTMRDDLMRYGTVRAFNKELDEENRIIFKEILRYIKRVHSLIPTNINTLLADGDSETIAQIWPRNSLDVSNKKVLVSEYAMKSPEELFAEAFSFDVSGFQPIPKGIKKLLDKTMAAVKAGASADDSEVESEPDEDEE